MALSSWMEAISPNLSLLAASLGTNLSKNDRPRMVSKYLLTVQPAFRTFPKEERASINGLCGKEANMSANV